MTDALNLVIRAVQAIPGPVKKAFAAFVVIGGSVVALLGAIQIAKGAIGLFLVGIKLLGTADRTADFSNRAPDGSLRHPESFVTLNLRAGIHTGRWSFELYGKNLTNETGVTSIDAEGFLPNGAVGLALIRPRTIGVSVGTRFWGS